MPIMSPSRLRAGSTDCHGSGSPRAGPGAAGSVTALLVARGHRLERQRARIDAVPLTGRLGAVVEDVAKVAAAAAAHDLGAPHEKAVVRAQLDRLGDRGLVEARPAGARVELGVRAEQPGATAGAPVEAVPVVAEIRAGERHLGVRLTQHVVLQWSQFAAPLLVRLGDLAGGGCLGAGTRPTHDRLPFPLVPHRVRPAPRQNDVPVTTPARDRQTGAATRTNPAPPALGRSHSAGAGSREYAPARLMDGDDVRSVHDDGRPDQAVLLLRRDSR